MLSNVIIVNISFTCRRHFVTRLSDYNDWLYYDQEYKVISSLTQDLGFCGFI